MAKVLEERMYELLKDARIISVICNQWGDTGKGKFSDLFAVQWADVIARGTGGNNAGHTVVINGKDKIFHLIPSGILYDKQGKVNVLGNGMVIDLFALCKELDQLTAWERSYNNLIVSKDAFVTFPFHTDYDKQKNASQTNGGIGSTGRGIGPTYSDKVSRRGIMIEDLFNIDSLSRKIEKALRHYQTIRRGEYVKELLDKHTSPEDLYFALKSREIDPKMQTERIIEELKPASERIKPLVRDTIKEMNTFARQGKKILLEGAQGLLLSVEYGTYNCVTSSDCSLAGTVAGVGLPANSVDMSFGIVKYPFMTRVGAGPFPTELGGRKSEEYCALGLEHDIFYEAKEYIGMNLDLDMIRNLQKEQNSAELAKLKREVSSYIKANREKVSQLINSSDPFTKGVGIRLAAGEYGATTGRPRRTGCTDAVAAKYAVGINGPLFILTKPDSISGCDEFSLCYGYDNNLVQSIDFNRNYEYLRKVNPILKNYKGYGDISSVTEFEELPKSLKDSMLDFEKFTGGKIAIVSNGPEKEQTIIR